MKKLVLLLILPFLLFACKSENKSDKALEAETETVDQSIAYASFGAEITDVTIDIQNGCTTRDVNGRMPINPPDHILKMPLNVHALQCMV